MFDFYGLKRLLVKEKLWTTEKEHSKVIKRVEGASKCNLPLELINEVFPYGFKSYDFNHKKYEFCNKIRRNNPFPPLPLLLQELSEEELRTYIEQLDLALQKQFDEFIENLYSINRNDDDFENVKDIFTRKFFKWIRLEGLFVILLFAYIPIMIIAMFMINNINIPLFLSPILITFFLLMFFGISINKYFKIGKDKYPKISNNKN